MFFQIIACALIVLILGRIAWQFRRGTISGKEFFFWSLFWVLAAAAILVPNALTMIANILGIGRGTDLAFYGSFVIVAYVLFRMVVRLDRIERDVTKVVRHLALKDQQNQKSKIKNQNFNSKI